MTTRGVAKGDWVESKLTGQKWIVYETNSEGVSLRTERGGFEAFFDWDQFDLDLRTTHDAIVAPPPIVEHATGARREADTLPYDDIPANWLMWLAEVFRSGEQRYGKHNWKKGLPASTCYNHMMHHLAKYKEGDRTEDHLGKVAWGALALKWTMKYHPELDDLTDLVNDPRTNDSPAS